MHKLETCVSIYKKIIYDSLYYKYRSNMNTSIRTDNTSYHNDNFILFGENNEYIKLNYMKKLFYKIIDCKINTLHEKIRFFNKETYDISEYHLKINDLI